MSCEGNRHKFLGHLATVFPALDAAEMERIYQSARAAGVQSPDEETEKTRRLFADMQALGIKPPTHSPDGLPKPASRAGYAALYDYIIAHAQTKPYRFDEVHAALRTLPSQLSSDVWNALPVNLNTYYDGVGTNAAGYYYHHFTHPDELPDGVGYRQTDRQSVDDIVAYSGAGAAYRVQLDDIQDFFRNFQPDADGFYPDGYNGAGFDRDGFDSLGFSLYGIHRDDLANREKVKKWAGKRVVIRVARTGLKNPKEYDVDCEGFGDDGFAPTERNPFDDRDRFGYNRLGFRNGRSWTGYDENGLDENGNPAPRRKNFDVWGYSTKDGLTAPDAQGRRYNVIGWVYDPATGECFDPDDPRRRMKHNFKRKKVNGRFKVVLEKSWTPTEAQMVRRIRNPRLRMQEVAQGGPLLRYMGLEQYHRRNLVRGNAPWWRYLRSETRTRRKPEASYFGIRLRCPKCGQFTGAKPHLCPATGNEKITALADGSIIAWRKGVSRPAGSGGESPSSVRYLRFDEKKQGLFPDVADRLIERPSKFDVDISGVRNPSLWGVSDEARKLANESAALIDGKQPGLRAEAPDEQRWVGLARTSHHVGLFLAPESADETAILLENPHRPDFDPDFDGGPLGGFHWRSGLTREGFDWSGFHYLTRRSKDGYSIEDLIRHAKMRQGIFEWQEKLRQHGKTLVQALEATYSAIATSMAGAPRRVRIATEGGPRSGMFWTDMRGRIQAEMYPLGHDADDLFNMLALKAGIYHELGHEEDTPVGIFRRVVDIAKGKEEVPGLPREGTGLVAEIYNILEDGRMERSQARKRRGVAAVLAEDAKHNPRWDEAVGEDVPLEHQVMGLMLYRSLPFFRVRREVLEAAPSRVRKLYAEVQPLVDRAMRSPEETFAAAIEITRKLARDPDMQQFARQMTRQQSWGGQWTRGKGENGHTIIISGIPQPSGGQADRSLPIPMPGWGQSDDQASGQGGQRGAKPDDRTSGQGRQQGAKQDDQSGGQGRQRGAKQDSQATGQGRQRSAKQDDQTGGQGRQKGAKQDDQSGGQGRQQGAKQDDQTGGQGRQQGAKQDDQTSGQGRQSSDQSGQSAGAAGGGGSVTPEPDEAFFNNLAAAADLSTLAAGISADIRRGGTSVLRSPVGRQLQAPSSQYQSINVELAPEKTADFVVYRPESAPQTHDAGRRTVRSIWQNARSEGQRVARRLETLREQVRKKTRIQTSGVPDRRRFKRAVTGSRAVYRRDQLQDITSLAVSIQLDMSGSMDKYIYGGQLAGATVALGAALDKLDAAWMVTGFGTQYRLFKSFGDAFTEDRAAGLATDQLGGTQAAPGFKLGLDGLKEQPVANKLHIMMTDGMLHDPEETTRLAGEMKVRGILPFGIFFGKNISPNAQAQLDAIFGPGNWAHVRQLSDMSEVVAKRIERIYRRILATR